MDGLAAAIRRFIDDKIIFGDGLLVSLMAGQKECCPGWINYYYLK
jgi:hypothetical protein